MYELLLHIVWSNDEQQHSEQSDCVQGAAGAGDKEGGDSQRRDQLQWAVAHDAAHLFRPHQDQRRVHHQVHRRGYNLMLKYLEN